MTTTQQQADHWTTCPCGKRAYRSRRAARRAYKNAHPDGGLNAYRCPMIRDTWHAGHRDQAARDLHNRLDHRTQEQKP